MQSWAGVGVGASERGRRAPQRQVTGGRTGPVEEPGLHLKAPGAPEGLEALQGQDPVCIGESPELESVPSVRLP